MIPLDYNSLLIALSFCSAGLAITFFVSWVVSQADRVLMTWAIGAAFQVVSIFAYSDFVNRFSVPSGISAFSALLVGFVFFYGASHQFRTGDLPLPQMIVTAVVSSVVTAAPMLLGYAGITFIIFNFAAMAILLATAWQYWRWRAESPLLITTLSCLYLIVGVSFGLCSAVLIADQSWVMNHAPEDWAEQLNLILCLMGIAAIGALSLGLNQVRLVRRHKRDAETDALTGLFNRRALFEHSAGMRPTSTVIVMVFDIDHFKQVNDVHGHLLGDVVLQTFANILKETVREGDLAARLGGEEFSVLLPDASLKTALMVAERVRNKFAERRFLSDDVLFGSSVSVGISKIGARTALHDLMVQADAALYVAKRSGRNRVILFSSREEVRRQKDGTTPIELLMSEPEHADLYAAVADEATHQRKDRLARRI